MKKNQNTFWLKTKSLAGALAALLLSQAAVQAQCLTGNQYPSNSITPVCNGVTYTTIATNNWAGEYAVVNVTAGETYEFKSSIATDYLTISANNGTSAAAHGVQPLTWIASTTGSVRVYFHTNAACGTQNSSRTTSVKCGLAPSCAPPTTAATSNLTTTSASLNWTAPATAPANGYDYHYSTSATDPTTTTTPAGSVGAGILSAPLSGLTANTRYYFWIRSNCSASSKSMWTARDSFYTGHCIPTSTGSQYVSSFSTSGAVANVNYTASSAIPYVNNTASVIQTFPGNSFDCHIAANAGTHFFYIWVDWNNDLDFSDQGETVLATTSYTTDINHTIQIPAGTPAGSHRMRVANSELFTITPCGPASWGTYVDFTLQVGATPSCLAPTNLVATAITNASAALSWTAPASNPASGYEYYYSTSNTAPNNTTVASGTVAAGITTVTLPLLAQNTNYYFWVRSVCSASDKSAWSSTLTFKTELLAPTTWQEEFNTINTPAGFDISGWNIGTVSSFSGTPPNYLYKNHYGSLTFGAFSTLNVGPLAATDSLKFKYRAGQFSSPYGPPLAGAGYFKVFISTNFGNSYTQIDSLPLPSVNAWDSLAYPLNNYVGQNVKVKIESYSISSVGDDYYIAFDNFFIGSPPCTPPTVNLGADTSICSGTALTLNAGNATGVTYTWSNGATTSSIDVTTAGTYSVAASRGACTTRDTIVVGIVQTPVVNLGADTTICAATYQLDAGAGSGYTYLWNNSTTAQTLTVSTSGQYHVTVRNGNCSAADTVNVTFNTVPSVSGITATPNPAPTYSFTANSAGNATSYLWNFGHNNATANTAAASYTYPSLTTPANYTVTLKLSNNCGDTTVSTVVNVTPVSVNNLKLNNNSLKLFPNPGSHTVKLINESNYKMKQIIVSNILGQTVANIPVHNTAQQIIDVNRLPAGLYNVRIEFEEGTVVRKLEVIK